MQTLILNLIIYLLSIILFNISFYIIIIDVLSIFNAKLQISFNLCNFFGIIFVIIAFFCIFVVH